MPCSGGERAEIVQQVDEKVGLRLGPICLLSGPLTLLGTDWKE